ncbi:MAG: PAS domain-containing hybrid sensor histidine kinase/response regulator [Gemmatimonadales bacterium]|nr:MAG: PAS domain-containing hybrid sensor histidine kinase/response regulator [Gemmatimonadales bacterium]
MAKVREASAFHGAVEEVLALVVAGEADRETLEAAAAVLPGFEGEARSFARAFVWFRGAEFVDAAVTEWAFAQQQVAEIASLAPALETAVAQGDDARVQSILADVNRLDGEIGDFRGRFTEASDRWARVALRGSATALSLLGVVLLILGSLGLAYVFRRLERSEAELRESRARFEQVTAAIREVFWLTSPDKTEAFYVSPGFESVWGRRIQDAWADPMGWLEQVHPEDRERVRASLPAQQEGHHEIEYRIRTASGQVKHLRDRAFPVLDEEGRVIRVAGMTEDITERKALEQELLQTNKLRSVAHLAAGVAHEFNNLLTAMRSHVQFLEQDLADRPDTRQDLQGIREAADRAGTLTRKLLAFGRQQIVLPGPVHLSALVSDTEPLLRSLLPPRIRLEIEAPADLPAARADREHLREALLSLVINSRDALDGGGTIRIETRRLAEADLSPVRPGDPTSRRIAVEGRPLDGDSFVVLEIRDDGTGMTEDIRGQVFEPFFGGRSGAAAAGLGLPAVLGLMEQMNGGVAMDSRPGEGTRVRLFLPLDPVGSVDPAEVAA